MVYKSKYEIMDNIKDTVDIETIIKPVYLILRLPLSNMISAIRICGDI